MRLALMASARTADDRWLTAEQRGGRLFSQPAPENPGQRSLHDLRPDIDEPSDFEWDQRTRGASSSGPRVNSHFGDVKEPLVDFIRGSEAVVGCVAWLTDLEVLDELAKIDGALVVQKEDFLRPDLGAKGDDWKDRLRQRYDNIDNPWMRWWFPEPLRSMSTLRLSGIDGVRCVGNHNSERKAASPRMHHKFLVRLRPTVIPGHVVQGLEMADSIALEAESVWTGSFNFTRNAGFSFENAVVIHDAAIAHSYFEEFSRVASLSEPLDWTSRWVEPEWRLGT